MRVTSIKNVRNFILATFLKNYKKEAPYVYWTNDRFFPRFDKEIKNILDQVGCYVILNINEKPEVYTTPFNLLLNSNISGWALGGIPASQPLIYSIYTKKSDREKGKTRRNIELLFDKMGQPKNIKLVYPTTHTFNCIRHVLQGRCRVYVDT